MARLALADRLQRRSGSSVGIADPEPSAACSNAPNAL